LPKRSPQAEINPAVFVWLRKSSGWTVSDVAKRISTSIEVVQAIESGTRKPTLRQLKDLATAFRRPLAAFFLPEPKKEKPLPKDYRTINSNLKGQFDKKTILAIRKARYYQSITQELTKNIDTSIVPEITPAELSMNPIVLASKIRNKFNLTLDLQKSFKTSYNFFNYLRDILENWNILVFRFSMPIDDARGFVLADENPAVLVVNSKDTIEARIFTLMHEYAHLLLGESVIDTPSIFDSDSFKIEHWCNTFASNFLLPRNNAQEIFTANQASLTESKNLNRLSRKIKLSKAMLLYNMYKYEFISQVELNSVLSRYTPVLIPETQEGVHIPVDRKKLAELGEKFISLVANNYEQQHITINDALSYLSIKAKHFDKILSKAGK